MSRYLEDGALRACDEVRRKKRGRRSKGDTRWRNEGVKETMSKHSPPLFPHMVMCRHSEGEE